MSFRNKRVTDFESKDCSGCALCVACCPKNCITMQSDDLGYMRPVIDDSLCIDCGLCTKKCIIENPEALSHPILTAAAIRSDEEKLILSSSGGVFAAIAEQLISKGWMVAGCIMDEQLTPRHVLTSNIQVVKQMYGSKYVQSNTEGVYKDVAEVLQKGKKVLFSGTPCQVAAVKRFTKNNENLLTVEVICHGVPNVEMLHSYLDLHSRSSIKKMIFRDKRQGWTFNNLLELNNGKTKKINHRLSSCMTYFLEGETYRESCYVCPYAKPERVADITIGDFWGVVNRRPDLKNLIDIEKGVSCLIINNEKGKSIVDNCKIEKYQVSYEDIKDGNEPLNHPSRHTEKRTAILAEWAKNKNWADVDNYWKKHDFKFSYLIWSRVPTSLQHKIRILLGKR